VAKEYPEIKKIREYADEIKLQIENVICGSDRYITPTLESKKKAAIKELDGISDKLAKHAADIVAPKSDDDENKKDTDRIDMMEMRKLANGLKLATVLKMQEKNAVYWIYKIDTLGNPRKPKKTK
jgi:hypothetical protein